jgi:hypothetical protein
MSDVSCVIFYSGKMLQTIEFPQVALNINLFEGPLLITIFDLFRNNVMNYYGEKRIKLWTTA